MSEEKTVKGLEAFCNAVEKIAQKEGAIKVVDKTQKTKDGKECCTYYLPDHRQDNAIALRELLRENCDSVELVQEMADTAELLRAKKYTIGNRRYVAKLKDDTPGKEAALESINDLLSIIDAQMEVLERAKKRDDSEVCPHFETGLTAGKLIEIKKRLENQGYLEKISGSDWLCMFEKDTDKYPPPDETPHPICTNKLSKQKLADLMQKICGKGSELRPAIRYYFGDKMVTKRAYDRNKETWLTELLAGLVPK